MEQLKPVAAWTTKSEIDFLTFLASDDKRPDKAERPTIEQRKAKLMVWLGTSYKRQWDAGVDVEKCRDYAAKLHSDLCGIEQSA